MENKISIDYIQDKLLSSFWKFVRFMDIRKNGRVLVPNVPLYKDLCKKISELDKDTMILLPRRHLKTLLASLFITWYILKYPNNAVVIITDTRKKGIRLLKGIKSFFYSHKMLKAFFPEHRLAKIGNNEDTLTLSNRTTFAKEPNIATYSIEQPVQSARADLILKEDIVSDKFVKSKANREMIRYNLESLEAILESDSKQVVTGTRYTTDDPYNDIIEENNALPDKWNIIAYGVHREDGSALCEQVMSLNEIESIKRKHTAFFFASQYLNSPINDEINIFNIDTYDRYDTIPNLDYVFMAVDLSDGDGGDKNAFVVVGKADNKYYLLDAYGNNRINSEDFYYVIRQFYNRYAEKCLSVIVELNRNGKTIYRDTFTRLKTEHGDNMPFTGIHNIENKNIRIEKLEPMLKSSELILPATHIVDANPGLSALLDELRDFNFTTTANQDDLIDSLSMCIVAMQRREIVMKRQKNKKNRFVAKMF